MDKKPQVNISRRAFLAGTSGFALGLAISTGSLGLLSGCTSKPKQESQISPKTSQASVGKLFRESWEYKKLSPTKAAEIAYESYFENFCTYSVVKGVVEQLRDKVGEPWASFPIEAFAQFHGGVAGWGTVCGTLIGASIPIGLITWDPDAELYFETPEYMTSDIMRWYAKTKLPKFKPVKPIKTEIKASTVAGTPLCHVSVNKWMKAEGDVGFFSEYRVERCARLAADVSAKTVELLNLWKDGAYMPEGEPPYLIYKTTCQENCKDCHTSGVPEVPTKGNPPAPSGT